MKEAAHHTLPWEEELAELLHSPCWFSFGQSVRKDTRVKELALISAVTLLFWVALGR